jgi:hypothetical protein
MEMDLRIPNWIVLLVKNNLYDLPQLRLALRAASQSAVGYWWNLTLQICRPSGALNQARSAREQMLKGIRKGD